MGEIVVTQFVSLDGVIEDPGGSEDFEYGGWSFKFDRGDDGNQFKLEEVMGAEALLLGRKTYEGFAEAWPSREGEFADKFNNMAKFVVSTTLGEPEWNNTTVIKDDVAGEVAKVKDQTGGDILINGSATLLPTLMENDLIDEWRLMTFPVVLGKGLKLFADGSPHTTLKLTDTKPVGPDGIVVLTYRQP
jgi:dihydrofolate reductase